MSRSSRWKFISGILISIFFVYLALREVDLARMWAVIESAKLFPISIVIGVTLIQFVIRAWRWDILLEPIQKTGFFSRLHSTIVGFAANCILPARLGEFIRANYLGQREKISGSSAFGTIVIERLFDGFTLLLVLMVGLMVTTFPARWQPISGSLRGTGFLVLAGYIFLVVLLVGFRYKAESFVGLLDRLVFFLPDRHRCRIIELFKNFSLGLALSRRPFSWVQAVFYSFLLWFTALYQIQLVEQSLSISLPFVATFLVLAVASFGAMIPSAPGYVGTFHLAVQYGFLFYGVGREEALSAAIVWHAAVFFPTLLFGLVSMLFLHTPVGWPSKESMIQEGNRVSGR